jgi:hypothetical protein
MTPIDYLKWDNLVDSDSESEKVTKSNYLPSKTPKEPTIASPCSATKPYPLKELLERTRNYTPENEGNIHISLEDSWES